MKLTSTTPKSHGLKVFTFQHAMKKKSREITVMAMNESSARTKAWKRVSELYKNGTNSEPETQVNDGE